MSKVVGGRPEIASGGEELALGQGGEQRLDLGALAFGRRRDRGAIRRLRYLEHLLWPLTPRLFAPGLTRFVPESLPPASSRRRAGSSRAHPV
jgi:hypothetical protein